MSQLLASWIESRTPPAPAELREHLMRHVGGSEAGLPPAGEGSRALTGSPEPAEGAPRANRGEPRANRDVPEALVSAADNALQRVLDSGAASRDSALDLLSADAFVTYAFEAAADDPASVAGRADAAMRQVSARAVTYLDRNAT